MYLLFGTIARKKQTLNNLMNSVLKVCTKELVQTPKKVIYSNIIEEQISLIEDELEKYNVFPNSLLRWISIKLIDDDTKLLQSIEENFSVSLLNNHKIQELKNTAQSQINKNGDFKDTIVSTIIHHAENICKKVCTFENSNYSSRDRKIDKILTSKVFGFPIMILFLGIIFWLTIVGSNYPSSFLFSCFNWLQLKLIQFANFVHCPLWLSDMLILRHLSNSNLDCCCNASSYGYFLSSFYFFRGFRIFA